MGELEVRLSKNLTGRAKEVSVRKEVDALKVLLAGVEILFREEHTALVNAFGAHTAVTKAQTAPLCVCGEMRAMVVVLCSHIVRLGNIKSDVAAIAGTVQAVENKANTVTPDVSSRNERIDDARLAF